MVLFSITTGAAIGIIIDVFKTHDIKLARQLYNYLNPGDIALGDRAFCAYSDIYFLQNLRCDAIFRKHQGRKKQIKKGKRIGPCDCLVTWQKPKSCPKGLSKEEFDFISSQSSPERSSLLYLYSAAIEPSKLP